MEAQAPEREVRNQVEWAFLGLLSGCLLVASLAQVMYLAYWPLVVFGQPLNRTGSVLVALARLGFYPALAWGLLHLRPAAAAVLTLEIWRTFLLYAAHMATRGWLYGSGPLYPAGWAQGPLACALPAVLAVNVAIAQGWHPGPGLEALTRQGSQVLAVVMAFGAAWLRQSLHIFGVAPNRATRLLLRQGAPPVLLLTAGEALAWYFFRQP